MAEDRYRLEPVRDARARDERTRKSVLAGAIADANNADAHLTAARARTEAARLALAAALTARDATPTAHARALADRFVRRRRRELADARTHELAAEAARADHQGVVDAARLQLARARADREVIERHFARWRDERKKAAERRED
ncbi:MAG: hypothetical protein JO257_02825 [Deltaproteobacteria bacterium]|nr:hypothetical protein [Deltaproteobacteria bacterium]